MFIVDFGRCDKTALRSALRTVPQDDFDKITSSPTVCWKITTNSFWEDYYFGSSVSDPRSIHFQIPKHGLSSYERSRILAFTIMKDEIRVKMACEHVDQVKIPDGMQAPMEGQIIFYDKEEEPILSAFVYYHWNQGDEDDFNKIKITLKNVHMSPWFQWRKDTKGISRLPIKSPRGHVYPELTEEECDLSFVRVILPSEP